MGISASGLGSGLDINGLVTQLMSAERGPLNQLKAKQANINSKLSAFGSMKSAIATFQNALKGVSSSGLNALTTTTSSPTILTASSVTDGSATPGSYAIEVIKLAQQQKLSSAAIAPGATLSATDSTMSITVAGKTTPVTVADFSLKGISNAINAAGAGVSATIVNDGTSDRLVVTSKNSGTANTVTIAATGGLAQFDTSATGTMTETVLAANAELKIDGIAVTKSSNTITDAIRGITLNLAQTNAGSPATVTVARDAAAVKTAITAFVDAYNTLNTTLSKMTSYDVASKSGGVLNGDSSAASIMRTLRKEMTTAVSGAGSLSTLSDIGIGFQRDGKLAIENSTKLQKALDGNFDNLAQLFSSTGGYATRLNSVTADMLGTKGVIAARTGGLNNTIAGLTKNQATLEDRLVLTEKRYRAQFSALDTMMSQMQSTSGFLSQQLTALSNNY